MKLDPNESLDIICPACQRPSRAVLNLTQALCTTAESECAVIMFNPSQPDLVIGDINRITEDDFAE